jgi:hypothetical protein
MRKISLLIRYSVIALTASAVLPTECTAAGKLYKWVDDNGQIRYGDHIPAQYADKGNERLNNQGLVVDTKEPAKTQEQLAEEQRLAEIAEQEEVKRKERALHDHILLDTFTNEEEMILTRDGKIEAVEANIRVTNGRIEKLKQRLARLNHQAASMERSGRPVPESIANQITESHTQIQNNLDYIEKRKLEQQKIRDNFERDINRYRELKQAIAGNPP